MSDDDLDLQPMNRGRYRPMLIGLVVVAVGAGAAVMINARLAGSRRTDALARAGTAWNQLRRCLVGEGPPRGERIAAYARRIELGLPQSERDADPGARGSAWPFRCARPANLLTHALFESGSAEERHRLLAMMASRASMALESGELHSAREDRQGYLDELFAAAEQAELPAGDPATNLPPPTPAHPLTATSMNAIFAGAESAGIAGVEPVARAGAARVVAGTSRFRACTLAAGERPLSSVRCDDLPFAGATSAPELVSVEGDGPAWVRAQAPSGESDLYRVGSAQPMLRGGRDGYVNAAGLAASLREVPGPRPAGAPEGARWEVVWAGEGAAARVNVPVVVPPGSGEAVWGPALVGDRVLLVVPRADTAAAHAPGDAGASADAGPSDAAVDGSVDAAADAAVDASRDAGDAGDAARPSAPPRAGTLFAGQIPASGDGPITLASVGPLPPLASDARTHACATTDGTAIWFPAVGDRAALVFATATGANAPVEGDAPARATLTCRDATATLTWTEIGAVRRLHQLRCTAHGCTAVQGPMPDFDGDALVADLDGRVLLVGTPRGGGLRMRVGEVGQIHQAPEITVIDDAAHGGLALAPLRALVPSGSAAVVLVTNTTLAEESYAIRLDASGSFAPVRVRTATTRP
jgi:hypothetical protein